MKRKEIFEYSLYQLLNRFKEKAFKELAHQKAGDPVDEDWTLEECSASDFTLAMERLDICRFDDPSPKPLEESE